VTAGVPDLRQLARLPQLKTLSLGSTGLANQTIEELRAALPNVTVKN
jgi:hypothetical protein